MKQIIDYQKKSLKLVLQATGIPFLDPAEYYHPREIDPDMEDPRLDPDYIKEQQDIAAIERRETLTEDDKRFIAESDGKEYHETLNGEAIDQATKVSEETDDERERENEVHEDQSSRWRDGDAIEED